MAKENKNAQAPETGASDIPTGTNKPGLEAATADGTAAATETKTEKPAAKPKATSRTAAKTKSTAATTKKAAAATEALGTAAAAAAPAVKKVAAASLETIGKKILAENPKQPEVYVIANGRAFFNPADASNAARRLTNNTVTTVKR